MTAAVVGVLGLSRSAAADLFGVMVTSPTADDVTVTGSSLFDLVDDLSGREAEFEQFENNAFTASVRYAGLNQAITLDSNADNSVITLEIPSTGFSRTFSEADGPIEDQIEDFLQQDGADTLAEFLSVVNEQTLAGVADGNPSALTAVLANDAFRKFGQFNNPFVGYSQGADSSLYFHYGQIETDSGDGYELVGSLSTGFKFTDNVSLVLSTPLQLRDLEGSETYAVGSIIGLPIKLTPAMSDEQPILVQVTPFFAGGVAGSVDQLSGGVLLGGGGDALVALRLGDFTVSGGAQLSFHEGTPIEYGDYRFETEVSQQILKVGPALTYGGVGQSAHATVGVTYTQFLSDAAVDNYISPYVALGLKLGEGGQLRIGYEGDYGDGYTTHKAQIALMFAK